MKPITLVILVPFGVAAAYYYFAEEDSEKPQGSKSERVLMAFWISGITASIIAGLLGLDPG